MKFLNLTGQGLALLLFCVFTSCDRLLPPSGGRGELVPVKIRSVSVRGYGEAPGTRSAGGERRIVDQLVIQDLGGGMLAKITVEENVSALRADLWENMKFRIIALKAGSLHDYADYTMPASAGGSIAPDEGFDELACEVGQTYDFICYSYNSSTALPALLAENPFVLSVDGSKDLLYWSETGNEIEDGEALSINMMQQFTKVTLILDAGSRTITNVADNSIKISSVATPTTYINKDYRMPTANELKSIIPSPYSGFNRNTDDVPSGTSDDYAAGKYAFSDNYATLKDNRIFPASGSRSNAGTLASADGGHYWSGSAVYEESDSAYNLHFANGATVVYYDRISGRSIRCVLQE